ncbi:hypothetical protein BV25DRAFT_1986985 [Artomyces pyxidatus]|uniref:Uncharacterized protein n=1 Tax=Artomyces pyxidatus TaxID=48021 RepID=A0ACB8TIE3_9AGAM|nr:hypothetical protein BV25DRAFT_1986985 [Artomyces pyxidatus]
MSNSTALRVQDLPTGSKPGWELDEEIDEEEEAEPLHSVPESSVILVSLKQSRSNWLSTTFPKFSSKSRGGKASDTIPPSHTVRALGKCDLHVGPHIFSDTSIYEVHYLPPAPPPAARPVPPSHPTPNNGWQTTAPYSNTAFMSYGHYTVPAPVPVPSAQTPAQRASTPLVSSVAADTPMTPALVSRVNDAAASDPILANFLQLAASGRASAEQLKTLHILIQQLATVPSETTPSTPVPPTQVTTSAGSEATPNTKSQPPKASIPTAPTLLSTAGAAYAYAAYPYASQYTPQSVPVPVKEPDIVFEFREKPYDRWLFPRVPVFLERYPLLGPVSEIVISTALPFPNADSSKSGPEPPTAGIPAPQEVVRMRLTKIYPALWDGLFNWVGGQEKMDANDKLLRNIKPPDRVYLQHQIRDGELLAQIQAAVAPSYTMKSIKPAYSDKARPRRRSGPRKSVSDAADGATPKRRRSSQAKVVTPAKKIACVSCGQADVPLMMGGRFCRPCVEAGRITPSTGLLTSSTPIQQPTTTNVWTPSVPAGGTPTALDRGTSGLVASSLVSQSPLATNPPIPPPQQALSSTQS